MRKDKFYIGTLFLIAVSSTIALGFHDGLEFNTIALTIALYWIFSIIYFNLRYIFTTNKGITLDYGISYSLSIAVFLGPLGLLIYETLNRISVYISRKLTKTADEEEGLHTFYNIGSFALSSTFAYLLYWWLEPFFIQIPLGYWVLIVILMIIVVSLSDLFLAVILYLWGEITDRGKFVRFIKDRSFNDTLKSALSNGFLLYLLLENQFELVFVFFLINYTINRSIVYKARATQDKIERDQFEEMAYTDFLTAAYNRAYMNKRLEELADNASGEQIGIAIADLDRFKQLNDQYNHYVGDQVLQHFIDQVRLYLGEDGEVFRSGGEEFTLFIYGKTFDETYDLIDQLRQNIKTTSVTVDYLGKPENVEYSSSFGLYYFTISDEKSIEKAHIHADDLLYVSKERGRNRLTSHDATK
ncbi:GGDEF domain-containing protein [Filobacillus milosensis]|nr:GGDEF domain-containing protein [Filobacillus milosensis]